MNILVLGAGMVGRVIALGLAKRHRIVSADLDRDALDGLAKQGIETALVDVSDRDLLAREAGKHDLVVVAVPGHLGFGTVETLVGLGKRVVDISFSPEDPLQLGELAAATGAVAIVDAGVAPGLDNLILGHHDRMMEIETFECLVGGLPVRRKWPFAYKAPFSPIDVIEEYTRPARYVEGGRVVTRDALSDPELEWFEEVGTLVSFNTDGLRTLITTMHHVPNMKEKTLRYPGHIELVRALREVGFFSEQELEVGEPPVRVRPIDVTSRLLFDEWRLEPDEPEFTVMRVTISGIENGERVEVTYDLYDERNPKTGFSSMARTTGYTCTAMVEYLLEQGIGEPGIYPLELIGRRVGGFGLALRHLAERGVSLRMTRKPIP